MKSRKLGFAIFAALSLQTTSSKALEQLRPATTVHTSTNTTFTTINTTTYTSNNIAEVSYFVGDMASPIRAISHEMNFGGSDPSLDESATGLSEGTQSQCSVSIYKFCLLNAFFFAFRLKVGGKRTGKKRRQKKSKSLQ